MFIQDLLCYCYLCYIKEKDNGGGTFEHIQKRYFLKKWIVTEQVELHLYFVVEIGIDQDGR